MRKHINPLLSGGLYRNLSETVSVNVKHKDFSLEKKMTALELQHLKRKGKKIAMITAYDYPTVFHSQIVYLSHVSFTTSPVGKTC